MKLAYVLYSDYENHSSKGVINKINGEIKAFSKLGCEVTLFYQHDGNFVKKTDNETTRIPIKRGLTRYRMSVTYKLIQELKSSRYDLLYLRFPGSIDFSIYKLLKTAGKYCSKVVLEMPTYPIGGEIKQRLKRLCSFKTLPLLLYQTTAYGVHRILSRRLKNHVNYVLSFFEYKKIWGIPVINIDNGITLDDIKIQEKKNEISNTVRLVFVAAFSPWHGVDRIVKSLDDYYAEKTESDPDVILKLVGKGKSLDEVLKTEYYIRVKDKIQLLGEKHGKELDSVFDESDIAVSSLGMHRIGLTKGSTLKTKEYCARGIPFIYAYKEKLIDDDFKYALRFENDESIIDMKKIIQFYDKLKNTDYNAKMREFAERYEWKTQLNFFLTELNKEG